ncbi:unnamed protein product [Amoebophrya sp. A25]|nr:unnamed protein product [Amoebophrya sp. A25]|eukprot:GSA25T00001733001.1
MVASVPHSEGSPLLSRDTRRSGLVYGEAEVGAAVLRANAGTEHYAGGLNQSGSPTDACGEDDLAAEEARITYRRMVESGADGRRTGRGTAPASFSGMIPRKSIELPARGSSADPSRIGGKSSRVTHGTVLPTGPSDQTLVCTAGRSTFGPQLNEVVGQQHLPSLLQGGSQSFAARRQSLGDPGGYSVSLFMRANRKDYPAGHALYVFDKNCLPPRGPNEKDGSLPAVADNSVDEHHEQRRSNTGPRPDHGRFQDFSNCEEAKLTWHDLTFAVKTPPGGSSAPSSGSSRITGSSGDSSLSTSKSLSSRAWPRAGHSGKMLLKSCYGELLAGELTALVGPSGAGKSTLLNLLAARQSWEGKSGSIRLAGREMKFEDMRSAVAYVMQEDHLLGTQTVAETLKFAAELKLGHLLSAKQIRQRVEETLIDLDLVSVRDVCIGTTLKKGLSGGQKKRVSTAIELLARPKLLFLDEPTSGLDSFSSLKLISKLKEIAVRDRAIICCTIHQPSSELFDNFDRVMCLRQGEVLFQGYSGKRATLLLHIALGNFSAVPSIEQGDDSVGGAQNLNNPSITENKEHEENIEAAASPGTMRWPNRRNTLGGRASAGRGCFGLPVIVEGRKISGEDEEENPLVQEATGEEELSGHPGRISANGNCEDDEGTVGVVPTRASEEHQEIDANGGADEGHLGEDIADESPTGRGTDVDAWRASPSGQESSPNENKVESPSSENRAGARDARDNVVGNGANEDDDVVSFSLQEHKEETLARAGYVMNPSTQFGESYLHDSGREEEFPRSTASGFHHDATDGGRGMCSSIGSSREAFFRRANRARLQTISGFLELVVGQPIPEGYGTCDWVLYLAQSFSTQEFAEVRDNARALFLGLRNGYGSGDVASEGPARGDKSQGKAWSGSMTTTPRCTTGEMYASSANPSSIRLDKTDGKTLHADVTARLGCAAEVHEIISTCVLADGPGGLLQNTGDAGYLSDDDGLDHAGDIDEPSRGKTSLDHRNYKKNAHSGLKRHSSARARTTQRSGRKTFSLLLKREWTHRSRDVDAMVSKLLIPSISVLIYALAYANVGRELSGGVMRSSSDASDPQSDYYVHGEGEFRAKIRELHGPLGQIHLVVLMSAAQALLMSIAQERAIFNREYHSNLYGVSAYLLSKMLVETLLIFVQSAWLLVWPHLFWGLHAKFLTLWITMAGMGFCGMATGLFLATMNVNAPEKALLWGPVFLTAIPSCFSGSYRALQDMPSYLVWMQWITPSGYLIKLISYVEFAACATFMDSQVQVHSHASTSAPYSPAETAGFYREALGKYWAGMKVEDTKEFLVVNWSACVALVVFFCIASLGWLRVNSRTLF